jgi:aminoglycoside phosphotransferase (APT) family kinase protein
MNNEIQLGEEFVNYYSELKQEIFTLKSISRIFGGASRETYRLSVLNKDLIETNLIYRRTQSSALIETEQLTEYSAYLAFQDSKVPVPKTIAIEESPDTLGAPFMVMEELRGAAASPFDQEAYSPYEEKLGHQFWDILGEIVLKDIDDPNLASIPRTESKESCWKRELDHWVKVIRQDSYSVEPILEAAIRELYRNYPKDSAKKCLVHGDYRNGNFLSKEGTLVGILDWEMAHIGDPLEDLAWAMSPIWCWKDRDRPSYLIKRKEALDVWQKKTQIKIEVESLAWWELFACVKGLAIWISAGHEFITGSNTDPINLFSAWIPGDIHMEIILETLEKEFRSR